MLFSIDHSLNYYDRETTTALFKTEICLIVDILDMGMKKAIEDIEMKI